VPLYLGIDIGGTKIAGAIVTQDGLVLEQDECATEAVKGGPHVLWTAIKLAKELMEKSPEPIAGVGIGTGGQVDSDQGIIVSATDLLPGWAGTQVKAAFERELAVTAAVDNDVNALAVGESKLGIAQDKDTVVFLALGTGVGGALMVKGVLHRGAHWAGGEFGHLLISFDDQARRDSGGGTGTLEAYASGPGLVQTWREFTGKHDQVMTGREIAAHAMRHPNGSGADAIKETGKYLGFGLVSLANILDPDLIVIGGGLAELGDMLLDPARHILKTRALPGPASCPVVTASLGPNASVIGAAALVMPSA
jgi:glucokinase